MKPDVFIHPTPRPKWALTLLLLSVPALALSQGAAPGATATPAAVSSLTVATAGKQPAGQGITLFLLGFNARQLFDVDSSLGLLAFAGRGDLVVTVAIITAVASSELAII